MKILIIDAQGGGIGRQVISAVKAKFPRAELTAVGTNSLATAAMLKAARTTPQPEKTPSWSDVEGRTLLSVPSEWSSRTLCSER